MSIIYYFIVVIVVLSLIIGKLLYRYRRRKFFKDVIFKYEDSKNLLYKEIYKFALYNKLGNFRDITKSTKTFSEENDIKYPIILSGESIDDMQITDADRNVFHLVLRKPNEIIFYEEIDEETV